jgi:hypothetical protein
LRRSDVVVVAMRGLVEVLEGHVGVGSSGRSLAREVTRAVAPGRQRGNVFQYALGAGTTAGVPRLSLLR